MKQRGRPVRGAIAGLFFGLFLALDLVIFGVVAIDSNVLAVLPVLGLAGGFFVTAATALWFELGPVLGGATLGEEEAWTAVAGRLIAAAAIAAAPFVRGRVGPRCGKQSFF